MSSYRDGLEAATHRIDSLEQELAQHQGELQALQMRLATPTGAAPPRWPWYLAMFGAVLAGALLSSSLPAPGANTAAPSHQPQLDWGDDSIFADPAPQLASHRRSAAAANPPADGQAREDEQACGVAERKATLLVKLASGRASDGDLGDLHLSCVLSGDAACGQLTMAEIRARHLLPR